MYPSNQNNLIMKNLNELTNEILVNNGLDFVITKEPLFTLDGKKTNYFGLFNSKSNECINTVKDSYTISQNHEIVNLALQGMEPFGEDLIVKKAGSLNGGRKIFIQLSIKGFSKVNNDIIERYVTLIDSNDGSTSLSVGIGDLTMSCQNQFWKFYAKGNAKFRHTHTLKQRLSEIPKLIEIALNESLKQIEIYNKFVSTDVSKDLAHKLVKAILGYDKLYTPMAELSQKSTRAINIMDALYHNIEIETNDKGLNLWGLHSGITRYTTHELSTPKRENGRIESALIGNAYKYNQKSLQFATQLIS